MLPGSAPAPGTAARAAAPLSGLRVLVVEDEVMISLVLCDMVSDFGGTVAAAAGWLPKALELARYGVFDLAILDINLHGANAGEVADVLKSRGVPLVFATGYGESGIPPHLKDWPVVAKPYAEKDLRIGMLAALAKAA